MVLTSGTTGYAHGCTPTHATWLRRNRRDVVPDAAARDEVMLLSAPLFHT
jgi:acyl-CoA synthetase (AMP-forming)/AMP-acid ligase II